MGSIANGVICGVATGPEAGCTVAWGTLIFAAPSGRGRGSSVGATLAWRTCLLRWASGPGADGRGRGSAFRVAKLTRGAVLAFSLFLSYFPLPSPVSSIFALRRSSICLLRISRLCCSKSKGFTSPSASSSESESTWSPLIAVSSWSTRARRESLGRCSFSGARRPGRPRAVRICQNR